MSRAPTPQGAAGLASGVLVGAFAVALAIVFVTHPTHPSYDSITSLLWSRDLLDGTTPPFDDYRAPTQHPLLLLAGLPLAPFDDSGARAFVALCLVSLVALAAAVVRLGGLAGGALCGLVAVALVVTRLDLTLLALIGFLDIPYCALVAWAVVLETRTPRRGAPVWVLLTLAGLLRPEAWLLAGLYALWVGWPDGVRGIARVAPLPAIAPLVWAAVDLAVTGDPLFSFHHTDTLAAELARDRPTLELPWLMLELLDQLLKLPVLLAGLAGGIAAIALRRRELGVTIVLVAVTCATYLVIAGGGLATVNRYLLNAAIGLAVLAAFALTAWTDLPDGPRRRAWALAALALVLVGTGVTVARTNPAKALSDLDERARVRADLVDVLGNPDVTRARGCGPLTVPNHKLLSDVRWILELPPGGVHARSDRSRAAQRTGVAIVVDRRIERRPQVNVYETAADGLAAPPPPGFRPVAVTKRFAAWARCDGGSTSPTPPGTR